MDLVIFAQLIISGLANGALYALLALALVLSYRSTRAMNYAQGEMAMLSTFIALWLYGSVQWPFAVVFVVTVGVSFAFGGLAEVLVVRRVQDAPHLTLIIVTLGLLLTLNSIAALVWGYEFRTFPNPFPGVPFDLGGVFVPRLQLAVFGIGLVVVVALYLFFQLTEMGLAMRATATNPLASRLVGISVGRMRTLSWGMSASLGAIAGMLVAPTIFVHPNMMEGFLTFAFVAAIVGGLESPLGAVVGGLGLGVVQNLGAGYISSNYKFSIAFAVLIAALIIRPRGLFGRAVRKRV